MGFSLCGYILFINIDNAKGWILLVIGSLFAVAKLFFFIKRQYQAIEKAQQEMEMRKIEIKRKRQEANEIEIRQLEEELSLRITGLTPKQRKAQ